MLVILGNSFAAPSKNSRIESVSNEITENEKKELLILKNYELLVKYKTYIESEISKGYQNNKLIYYQSSNFHI